MSVISQLNKKYWWKIPTKDDQIKQLERLWAKKDSIIHIDMPKELLKKWVRLRIWK